MDYENLLKPIEIKDLKLRNRIVFDGLVTKMVEEDGTISDDLISLHQARARGGVGLNILEITSVHKPSSLKEYLSIAEDAYIEKLQELTEKIHNEGGKIGIQLWQSGLGAILEDGEALVPSDLDLQDGKDLKAASKEDLEELKLSFENGTRRAVEAGFDLIELYVGVNDTIHMFLDPAINKRDDEYGGSLENRARLLKEILIKIKGQMPDGMPLFLRLVTKDDYILGGLDLEEIIGVLNLVKDVGIDVVSASRGDITTPLVKYLMPPLEERRKLKTREMESLKEETGLKVMGITKLRDLDLIDKLVTDSIELIGMSRSILVDPDFVNKIKSGKIDEIIKCIGCNQGCFDIFIDQDDIILKENKNKISCLRNPGLGREEDYKIQKTEAPQKVAVVGAGIGGIEATRILHERGHEPILFEKTNKLGGQFVLAGEIIGKEDFRDAFINRAERLMDEGVEIRMGLEFKNEYINEEDFDAVIIATGAKTKKPDIKGVKLSKFYSAREILEERKYLKGDIVIIGGGFAGLTAGEFLLDKKDAKLTIIEREDTPAKNLGEIRKKTIVQSIKESGGTILTNSNCVGLDKNKVIYEDKKGKEHSLEADYIIIATGSESVKSNYIKQYCQDREIPFYVIGDALIPRKAEDAISEAYNIGIFEIE